MPQTNCRPTTSEICWTSLYPYVSVGSMTQMDVETHGSRASSLALILTSLPFNAQSFMPKKVDGERSTQRSGSGNDRHLRFMHPD